MEYLFFLTFKVNFFLLHHYLKVEISLQSPKVYIKVLSPYLHSISMQKSFGTLFHHLFFF